MLHPIKDGSSDFEFLLKEASKYSFSDFQNMPILKLIGYENKLPILLFCPCFIDKNDENDIYKGLLYYFSTVVEYKEYILLYCHTYIDSYTLLNGWLIQIYNFLPEDLKNNIYKIYILHSDITLKSILNLSFLNKLFLNKINYIIFDELCKILNKNKKDIYKILPFCIIKYEEYINNKEYISIFASRLKSQINRYTIPYTTYILPSTLTIILRILYKNLDINNILDLKCNSYYVYNFIYEIELGKPYPIYNDIGTVVCVFKLWLGSLPECLLLEKSVDIMIENIKNENNIVYINVNKESSIIRSILYKIIENLPTENYTVVCALIEFLRQVIQRSGMSVGHVAAAFAPFFFKSSSNEKISQNIMIITACEKMMKFMLLDSKFPQSYLKPPQSENKDKQIEASSEEEEEDSDESSDSDES
eukprot:GHVL01044020.1.p2 GENE.GHVL01044020.1~~GHVL01044020.1.p2  ORF type:complete len:419 (+),score=135.98 GHVL01044020.1:25-1281(+)